MKSIVEIDIPEIDIPKIDIPEIDIPEITQFNAIKRKKNGKLSYNENIK